MTKLDGAIHNLVLANRMLANEGVVESLLDTAEFRISLSGVYTSFVVSSFCRRV